MKATKHYENGAVMVYLHEDAREEGSQPVDMCLTFDSETQLRRAGECLKMLAIAGGNTVKVGE